MCVCVIFLKRITNVKEHCTKQNQCLHMLVQEATEMAVGYIGASYGNVAGIWQTSK